MPQRPLNDTDRLALTQALTREPLFLCVPSTAENLLDAQSSRAFEERHAILLASVQVDREVAVSVLELVGVYAEEDRPLGGDERAPLAVIPWAEVERHGLTADLPLGDLGRFGHNQTPWMEKIAPATTERFWQVAARHMPSAAAVARRLGVQLSAPVERERVREAKPTGHSPLRSSPRIVTRRRGESDTLPRLRPRDRAIGSDRPTVNRATAELPAIQSAPPLMPDAPSSLEDEALGETEDGPLPEAVRAEVDRRRRGETEGAIADTAPQPSGSTTPSLSTPALEAPPAQAPPEADREPQATLSAEAIREHLNGVGLRHGPVLYGRLAAALASPRHLVLVGPAGVGKTTLAHALCALAQSRDLAMGTTCLTATADWTSRDLLGRFAPDPQGAPTFRHGILASAMSRGHWVAIDGLERTDFDRALGELMTVMAGHPVELPRPPGVDPVWLLPASARADDGAPSLPEEAGLLVHPAFRLVATMDASALRGAMTPTLARRFAFVSIGPPSTSSLGELIDQWTEGLDALLRTSLREMWLEALSPQGPLGEVGGVGPALMRDTVLYTAARVEHGADHVAALCEAFETMVLPSLPGDLDAGEVWGGFDAIFGEPSQEPTVQTQREAALASLRRSMRWRWTRP